MGCSFPELLSEVPFSATSRNRHDLICETGVFNAAPSIKTGKNPGLPRPGRRCKSAVAKRLIGGRSASRQARKEQTVIISETRLKDSIRSRPMLYSAQQRKTWDRRCVRQACIQHPSSNPSRSPSALRQRCAATAPVACPSRLRPCHLDAILNMSGGFFQHPHLASDATCWHRQGQMMDTVVAGAWPARRLSNLQTPSPASFSLAWLEMPVPAVATEIYRQNSPKPLATLASRLPAREMPLTPASRPRLRVCLICRPSTSAGC